jgi:c(7)-type cytochrome triheme protein
VDLALQAGRIPTDLPFIKKVAVEALVRPYPSLAQAEPDIERFIRAYYAKEHPAVANGQQARLASAIDEVRRVFRQNFFPEMRVNWLAYPDNIGHKEFPGCFRCHDGRHVSKDGRVIDSSCGVCHEFLEAGPAGLTRVEATPAFAHPWKLGGKHAAIACSTCHTGGPAPPSTCRGCHEIPDHGVPMAGMACSECHQKEQERQPLVSCTGCHAQRAGLHTAPGHTAAECSACHVPHSWTPAPRETCLGCHADKADHNPGPPCAECHAFRGGKAGGAAPPAIAFRAGEGSPGPVTFAHDAHLARGARCADCHPGLFKMKKTGTAPTMDAMAEGKACGACHNGKAAFEVMDGDRCETCHRTPARAGR